MSEHHAAPKHKKRINPEKIGLAVVVYGTGILVAAVCILIFVLTLLYSGLSVFWDLVVGLLIMGVIAYIPYAIAEVYREVARR